MSSSHPPPPSCQWFSFLASALDPRSAPRLAWLFVGAILARGRRTVTSWIRAAGLSREYRPCYSAVAAVGARTDLTAAHLAHEVVKPLVAGAARLTFALDARKRPTAGRSVPSPGPARPHSRSPLREPLPGGAREVKPGRGVATPYGPTRRIVSRDP